jgi:hypothetical protein
MTGSDALMLAPWALFAACMIVIFLMLYRSARRPPRSARARGRRGPRRASRRGHREDENGDNRPDTTRP